MRWKIKLSVRANFSWPSLKETLRNAAKLKISFTILSILADRKSTRLSSNFFLYHSCKIFLIVLRLYSWQFFYRIAHSTSCSLIQLLKSHSREIWESKALQLNATGGSSSLMEMNAVDQWQLRLLCTTPGHLGVLSCFITDHLRDTVKTFHRAGLLWSYG